MGKELVRCKMIEITEMQKDHVEAIAELEKRCFSDPWPVAAIEPELTNPLSYWLVAMDEAVLAGYIGSQSVCGEADMMNVAVHPDYRRCGIAQRLIEALVAALKEREVTSLSLEVRASNTPAIALYDKLGFAQVGRRPNYYRNPKEDALIMRKTFSLSGEM